ncbi:tetratricopeptide repeat protein [Acidithiobacillus sulfuriphilus]|uniref:Tetratricopeptide repeat protein n=2 Tax=Acidithiobacillus sulfuriphilus TaxID=1867749 RepID=A0ACD5HM12_9PROT|nr:tetratricopeptide repeat protein [Acidithiobacillus sulfuriphilus]
MGTMGARLRGGMIGLALGLAAGVAGAGTVERGMTGEQLYYLLVAEFATLRHDPQLAIPAWREAARQSSSAKVLARATAVAAGFGDFPGALKLARRWRQVAPDSAAAAQYEAALLLTTGQESRAIALLQETVTRFPNDTRVTLQLADLLMSHGRPGEAQRLLQALISKDPRSAPAYFALGRLYLTQHRMDAAVTQLQKALALRPAWQEAAITLAEALRISQGPTAALRSIQSFTASHPEASMARQYLASLYLRMGGVEQAYRIYQNLARQNPQDPEIALSLGLIDMDRQDWAGARQALHEALRLAPHSPAPVYYLGRLYEAQGQWAEALQWYQRITSGPLFPEVELRSARIDYLLGHREKAMRQLQDLAARYPKQAQIPLLEAELRLDEGKAQEALSVLHDALQRLPDQPELWYEQGVIEEGLKDYPAMEKAMREVIRLAPNDAQAYNFIGFSLVERHTRLGEAETLLNKAIALAPESPEILDSLGWLYHVQGLNEKALPYLQKAHAAMPTDAEVSGHLGEVLWALQRYDEARQVWQDALRYHPDDATLQTLVARPRP